MIALMLLQAALQQPLELTCHGGGVVNKVSVTTAQSHGSVSGVVGSTPVMGSTSGTTTIYTPRQQGFDSQVDVRLFGGDDRIRMPRTMLPLIHGGADGWFKLKKVTGDERTIRASVAVNFMNSPKVFIDRVTGTISISGKAGDFTGQCQAVDVAAKPKF